MSAIFLYKLYEYGYHKHKAQGNKHFISISHILTGILFRGHCPCHLHHCARKLCDPVCARHCCRSWASWLTFTLSDLLLMSHWLYLPYSFWDGSMGRTYFLSPISSTLSVLYLQWPGQSTRAWKYIGWSISMQVLMHVPRTLQYRSQQFLVLQTHSQWMTHTWWAHYYRLWYHILQVYFHEVTVQNHPFPPLVFSHLKFQCFTYVLNVMPT